MSSQSMRVVSPIEGGFGAGATGVGVKTGVRVRVRVGVVIRVRTGVETLGAGIGVEIGIGGQEWSGDEGRVRVLVLQSMEGFVVSSYGIPRIIE